jgi:hypothetical protein
MDKISGRDTHSKEKEAPQRQVYPIFEVYATFV